MTCWGVFCTNRARIGICLCFVAVAFILDVIGFSVPYWYFENDGTTKMFEGLWKNCNEVAGVTSCTNWVEVDTPSWFKANQAVQTIGMIFLLVAVILLLILLICARDSYELKIATICFLGAAAMFILIGVIIYGAESSDMVTNNLNFAFVFVVVAAGLAILGAICLCIGIQHRWTEEV